MHGLEYRSGFPACLSARRIMNGIRELMADERYKRRGGKICRPAAIL